MSQIVNFSTRKVGGIRFVKVGRLTLMFCVSRAYKPMKVKPSRYASQQDWMNALHNGVVRCLMRS